MRRRDHTLAIAVVLALSAGIGPTFADSTFVESNKGSFEVGIDAGYSDLDEELGDNGTRALLRFGYFFTDRFQLELQGGGTFVDCEPPCEDFAHGLINGVFNFRPAPRWISYLSVGVGRTDLDDGDDEIEIPGISGPFSDQMIFQAAFGGKYALGADQRFGVRAEISVMSYENSSNPNLLVGILWRFGG